MHNDVKEFMVFMEKAHSSFHAVEQLRLLLENAGFTQLEECAAWNIRENGKYYVIRNRSAIIAFTSPGKGQKGLQIVASHSDSPTFKLKPLFEEGVQKHYIRFNVEQYGGMIMSTWFDRPLSVAGRVFVRTENGIEAKLVDLDRDSVLIPNMPIHFNREVNSGYAYNVQKDLLPLFGSAAAEGKFIETIADTAGVEKDAIVSYDLYLYDRTGSRVWGYDDAFISSGRLDDLECAYTSMRAFINAKAASHMNVCAVFDNEEVGSGSRQGADSDFLYDVLMRAFESLGYSVSESRAIMASGFMVSADNAHAVHPNHAEKYDADNCVYMNEGIVIKHNANQKYTTDAASDAVFSEICKRAGVPVQHFTNRSDIAGGSTLGNISNAHVSLNTLDIGLAQLAMHSAYETAGVKDISYMLNGLKAFYETDIRMKADGVFEF